MQAAVARRAVRDRVHGDGAVRLRARRRACVPHAASSPADGASVYNVPGDSVPVEDVVAAIRRVVADAEITVGGEPLPFPPELEAVGFERDIGPFPRTTLDDGVAATIAHFRRSEERSVG